MDILRLPVIGGFLRWRRARTALQLVLLAVAAIVVVHGLLGPQLAPRNAATTLTWVHYRGLLILVLVAAGNLLCTACPMILVRDAGRRFVHPGWRWPRWLRGKWIAIALIVAVLFAYELFDLWSLPRATAWLVLAYFGLALAVDLLFAGATFCKHLCPIGQFNFMAASMSPTELQVRDMGTCRACRTSDCIKGRYEAVPAAPTPRLQQRGCELGLFLPMKVGNLDCTMCLDCVQACPHDNVALVTRVPGVELLDTRRRSGIGRLARRPDLAALAVVFTFGALLNAFAMTAPVAALERRIAAALGVQSEALVLGLLFGVALVVLPALLLGTASLATTLLPSKSYVGAAFRRPGSASGAPSAADTAMAYAYAMVPLGVGVWLAHYSFHLLTGVFTALPVLQSAAIDLSGRALLGEPWWLAVGMQPGSVFPIQLGSVLLGTAGSLGLVHATSMREHPASAGLASAPWVTLVAALAAAALWILSQPMDMRGVSVLG